MLLLLLLMLLMVCMRSSHSHTALVALLVDSFNFLDTMWRSWLLSNRYPGVPPEFYVDLDVASNMQISQNHPCTDPNGKVSTAGITRFYTFIL